MSKRARDKEEQSLHDRRVQDVANKLEQKGWEVKADLNIEKFTDPPTIHGRRPDILAKKRGNQRLYEFETESSKNTERAKKQIERFRAWEGRNPKNREFEREVI